MTLVKSNNTEFILVVQSLSPVWLFATPWTTALQASLSFTISWSLLRFTSSSLMMLSNHLILWHRLLLPSVFPSIRVFFNELAVHIRCQSTGASASVLPVNIQGWCPLRLTSLISLLPKRMSRVISSTTILWHWFFSAQPSLFSNSHIHTWLLEKV